MQRAKPFIIIAVVILAIWGLSSLVSDGAQIGEPGSVYSTSESGLAALERWLEDIDFQTRRFEREEWWLDEETDALLIIAPRNAITDEEIQEALGWVRQTGGTLVVVDDSDNGLFRELNVTIEEDETGGEASSANPLARPPVAKIGGGPTLSTPREDAAVIMHAAGKPYVLAFAEGAGLIYVSSRVDIWSNQGLRDPNNAKLVLNTLSRVPPRGTVLFDEIHHGRGLPPAVPRNPTVFPPLVAALVYSALVIGIWAFFAGRRFGSPVPLRMDVARRTSAEYVQSMANLFARGRQTGYILNYYKSAFKRRLARPFGFNPRIDDERFVRELSRYIGVDEQRLAQLLQAMGADRPAETTLLGLVRESDAFAARLEQQR
ncbi:MAG TPA: DUF4350 domain-containing protein [Herpetosiphonaceae bacterium]